MLKCYRDGNYELPQYRHQRQVCIQFEYDHSSYSIASGATLVIYELVIVWLIVGNETICDCDG